MIENVQNQAQLPQRSPDVNLYDQTADNSGDSSKSAIISANNSSAIPSDDARKILTAIADEPEQKTTYYYEKLGFNPRQGNEARLNLARLELIEQKELPRIDGKGRFGKAFVLTQKGYDFLNKRPDSERHGSTLHKHLIRLVAKKYEGRRVDTEFPIGEGKSVDLVIDGKVAIEIERRDFSESNIRKNLDHGFAKVVVVCQGNEQRLRFESKARAIFQEEKRLVITSISALLRTPEIVDL